MFLALGRTDFLLQAHDLRIMTVLKFRGHCELPTVDQATSLPNTRPKGTAFQSANRDVTTAAFFVQ